MQPTISEQGLKERKRSKKAARERYVEYELLAGEIAKKFDDIVADLDHAALHLEVAKPWKG